MMISPREIFVLLLNSLNALPATSSPPKYGHDAIRPGTFQNPAVEVRPKFRYWLPDASIDPAGIAADIKSIGSIGAGGIELCNYYLYGGQVGIPASDWSIYGFGTPAYNKILRAAAQATKDNGLVIDFAIGPESGQGVPAEADNPGLAYDLVSFNIKISPGGVYEGKIPGHGNGTLVSVTTAAILNSTKFSEPNIVSGIIPNGYTNYTVWNISAESLSDVTDQVRRDGTISLRVPANRTVENYFLWASYYKLSLARAAIPGHDPKNFIQNGSFAVDHFSSRGARVTTDFLEKYVLINGVKELFQQVGKYIWEDSVEVHSNLFWTPDLAQIFRKMHGYEIEKYTMLLAVDNGLSSGSVYIDRVYSDAPDRGQGYVSDYRATMSSLLTVYYEHLVKWSKKYLGLEFSGQVGYNLPVDMLEIIPAVSAPEDESLAFDSSIDNYRQYVGPANLAGKKIISNEMGAQFRGNYQQHLPTLLTLAKQAYSAGNNQMVLHGATYSYQYPNTTWPGYSTFGYLFSEQHSRHQPGWDNGYSEVLDFIARNNHILQSGTPKRDIVFWSKKAREKDIAPVYEFQDLIGAGYGYEYISPSNFKLPQSIVKKGVLAPDGPEYKLLVLRSNEFLTSDGVEKLAQYAVQGLPIMISGGIPDKIASAKGLSAAISKLNSIASLSNVHMAPYGPLASAIASIGIQPLTKVSADQLWYTYWRELNKDKEAYVFIYNDGNSSSSGSICFANINLPYLLNAWTGEQTPVFQYKLDGGYTTIPLTLAPKQSVVVAFLSARKGSKRALYVTSGHASVLGYSYSKSNDLIAKVPLSADGLTISTSIGKKRRIFAKGTPKPFTLYDWTLVAEKWGPPVNFNDSSASSSKVNTTYHLPSLLSWPLIPGLQNTSGVGYYSNSFTWFDTSVGAFIDFGRVVHTLRVSINGHRIPPLDVTHAKADISAYLVKGRNEILATVSTTMINGLRPYLDRIQTSGLGPVLGSPSFLKLEVEAGLVGEVVVTPYKSVIIKG